MGAKTKETTGEPAPLLFGGWTGKTPATLLNEYIQRQQSEGWHRADYSMHGGPSNGYNCVIRLTKQDKKLGLQRIEFRPTPTLSTPLRFPTSAEARHMAATYVLHRLRANTSLHRLMPPVHRAYWLDLDTERKKEAGREWMYAEDPFAVQAARDRDRVDRAAARAKAEETRKTARESGRHEDLLPAGLRHRWDTLAEVAMSESQRTRAEQVVRTWTSTWNLESTVPSDKDPGAELVGTGFRASHVDEALKACDGDCVRALEWLCVHVPEDDLPPHVMHRAYRASLVAGPDDVDLAMTLAARRLARSGFSLAQCRQAISEARVQGPMAEARAAEILVARLSCQLPVPDPIVSNDLGTVDEEVEALDAIYAGEDRVAHPSPHQVSVGIRPTDRRLCPPDACLEFWIPVDGSYPEQRPPWVTLSSDALPAYLKLHVARTINGKLARDGMPVLFDAVTMADECIEQWLANPPLLGELMRGIKGTEPVVAPQTVEKQKKDRGPVMNASAKEWTRAVADFARAKSDPAYSRMQKTRAQLPAATVASALVLLVSSHRCVVVSGATGCGKTTQVPQFILDSGLLSNSPTSIVCTQPRRLSAIGVALRVADERGSVVGSTVGYAVRGESRRSAATRLLFCTTGVLLRMIAGDPALTGVTHVVCDEVHERSVDSDLLLVLLRKTLDISPGLRIVLMSATAQSDLFASYFGSECPVIDIPGRTFPVDDVYLDDFDANRLGRKGGVSIDFELAVDIVRHVHVTADRGLAVLVFMPGVAEIQATISALKDIQGLYVLPLHAGLSSSEQRRVFSRATEGGRKVVVATNIAETSITIDDIGFVVDSGRVRELRHDHGTRVARLVTVLCSQASAMQRRGRAGRTGPGVCYRMYSRHVFETMTPHADAEMLLAPLEQVCLRVKALGHNDPRAVLQAVLSPPPASSVQAAEQLLVAIGASSEEYGALTALGRFMADIPVDLRLAKMLVLGSVLGALDDALTLVAVMALDKPLFVGDREAVKKARMRFASDSMRDGMCDWLADLAALDARDACVSPAAARDVRTTVRQLRDALRHTGLVEPSKNATSPMVLKALVCAGLMPNIVRVRMPRPKYTEMIGGTVSKDHEAREVAFYAPTLSSSSTWKAYDFSKDRRVFVHPQSTLFAATKYRASPFVVYFAQSAPDNSRTYLRDATVPGLYALLMFGPPPLTVDHEHRVVGIGASGALSVRAWPRIAVLATSLRALLDELLRRKLDTPGDIVLAQHPVVQTVLQLIETDGQ